MLYDKRQWIEDIDAVMTVVPELDELAGRSVLITGAAGLIYSAVVDVLFRYNDTHARGIHILAAGHRTEAMCVRLANMVDREGFQYAPYDVSRIDEALDVHADSSMGGQCLSRQGDSGARGDDVGQFHGIADLLEYVSCQGTKRVLFISLSEVYGRKQGDQSFREDGYRYVDLLNPCNSCPIGKRAVETLCVSYAYEYRVESVIVRPGHICVPTLSEEDGRASSAWTQAVARHEDIVMKSGGAQLRSYCYCLDCASALLTVLIKGENGTAYNISNPDSIITIRELAQLLTKYSGTRLHLELPNDAERRRFNPMSNSSLESIRLIDLGWYGLFSAEVGLAHTVELLSAT